MDKIFDPFFTTKEIGVGTGLGLSTVLGIVKTHGGFINVCSKVGRTSFKIFLPALAEESAALAAQSEAESPSGNGETILVVDDEPGIRVIAEALLVRHGYKVLTAEDGPSALALFARHSSEIQLVLTDMAMPFIDGFSLARTVRRMNPQIKVIVSTGRDEDCRTAGLKTLRIQACLTKPYTRAKLLGTIEKVLSETPPCIDGQN
jgi:CheY-like chemotaxis protein